MVKTPKRRKKGQNDDDDDDEETVVENGGTPKRPQSDKIISPPASRLRSRKKRRRERESDDESMATTTDDDEGISKPPAAKRRNTRTRRKNSEDNASIYSTDANDDEEEEKPAAKKRRSTRAKKTKAKKTNTDDSGDESMTEAEESVAASDEDDDDDESMEGAKPRGQNGYKPAPAAALPPVQEEEESADETAAPTNGSKPAAAARLGPISKLRMPSKHTPGKLQTTAPAPTRTAAAAAAAGVSEESSRRFSFKEPTNNNHVLNQVPPAASAVGTLPTQQERKKQQQQQKQPGVSPQGVDNAELNAILVHGTQEESPEQVQRQQPQGSWKASLVTVVYSITEVATSLIVPSQPEQLAEGEDEDVEVEAPSAPLLTRMHVWFILLLFLHLACWNPLVTTVQDTSDRSLDFYKTILGQEPQQEQVEIVTEEAMEKPVVVKEEETTIPETTISLVDESILNELSSLEELLKFAEKDTSLAKEMEAVEQSLFEIRGRMRERTQALQDWKDGLADVESALYGLVSAESMDDVPRLFFRANEMLGFFKDMVPPTLATDILDTTYVFLWETASSNEYTPSSSDDDDNGLSDDPLLTHEMLKMGNEELQEMTRLSVSEIMTNEERMQALRAWVREALPENTTTSHDNEEESMPTNGLTQDMARDVIADFLEKQRADQLGVVDYASILAGASVIERATSPSLIDSLPLLNRLMAQAGLRFYGYGPQAALTPTYPVNSLGQCWSFDKDVSKVKKGKYATLTVELSKPIYVTTVVVEHAPKELTDQLESAIRSFRVFGYEDADDALEDPWPLGSFEYDIGAPRSLQEFEVVNHLDSEPLPKLRTITLAIDSNWGFVYSCLYRFRVLGGDDPSDKVTEASYGDVFVDESDETDYNDDVEEDIGDDTVVADETDYEDDPVDTSGHTHVEEEVSEPDNLADKTEYEDRYAVPEEVQDTASDDEWDENQDEDEEELDSAKEVRSEDDPMETSVDQDEHHSDDNEDGDIENDEALDGPGVVEDEESETDDTDHENEDGDREQDVDGEHDDEDVHRWDSDDHDHSESDNEDYSSGDGDSGDSAGEDEDSGDSGDEDGVRVEYRDGSRYVFREVDGDSGDDSRDD